VGVPASRAVDARVGVCDGPVAGPAHGVDGGGDEFAPVLLADVEQGGGGCRLGGLGGGHAVGTSAGMSSRTSRTAAPGLSCAPGCQGKSWATTVRTIRESSRI